MGGAPRSPGRGRSGGRSPRSRRPSPWRLLLCAGPWRLLLASGAWRAGAAPAAGWMGAGAAPAACWMGAGTAPAARWGKGGGDGGSGGALPSDALPSGGGQIWGGEGAGAQICFYRWSSTRVRGGIKGRKISRRSESNDRVQYFDGCCSKSNGNGIEGMRVKF